MAEDRTSRPDSASRPAARAPRSATGTGSGASLSQKPVVADVRRLALLGQRIRIYRLRQRQVHSARPWTQEDLAVAIGSDKAHVNRIEVGRQCPTLDTLQRVADALALPWGERLRLLTLGGYLVAPPSPDGDEIAEMAPRVSRTVHRTLYPACLVDQNQRVWDVNALFASVVLGFTDRDACLTDVRGRHTVELLCSKHAAGSYLRSVLSDFGAFARRNLMMFQRATQVDEQANAADEALLNDVLEDEDLCALWLTLSAHLPDESEPDYLDHQDLYIQLPGVDRPALVEVWHSVLAADDRFRVIHFSPSDDRTRRWFKELHEAPRRVESKRSSAAMVTPRVSGRCSQRFPARPISVTVPWAVGGSTDVCARILAPLMAHELQQPVLVENRDGSQSLRELERFSRLPPDGYSLTFLNQPALETSIVTGRATLAVYDSLALITTQALDPMGIFVRADSRFASLRELVRELERREGVVEVGTSGEFTPSHLGALMLQSRTGLRFRFRHYRGSAEHVARVLAGQTDIACLGSGLSLPALRAGELRALAMFVDARFPLLPEVPTAAECGYDGLTLISTRGIWTSAAVPDGVLTILRTAIQRAVAHPEHIRQMNLSGFAVRQMGAKEYEAFERGQRARIADLFSSFAAGPRERG